MDRYLVSYIKEPDRLVSERKLYRFENDYGASVIRGVATYGGEDDLWELAVIQWSGDDWNICDSTEIIDNSSGVIGYLSEEDVISILIDIKNLEK